MNATCCPSVAPITPVERAAGSFSSAHTADPGCELPLKYAPVKRLILLTMLLAACNRAETRQTASSAPPPPAPAGNVDRGKQLIVQYSCGVCHVIPGIEGAEGALGPTLAGVASRPAISEGVVQNTRANLMQYILKPGSLNPQSRMPPLGMSPDEAQDIAAFLLTLE